MVPRRVLLLAPILVLACGLSFYACSCIVSVNSFQPSSRYVCTGEQVSFNWSMNCVDKYKFDTGSGQHLATLGKHATSFTTPPVQANWDYIRMTGCQDDDCDNRLFDIQVIDNPKWTDKYFHSHEPGLTLIGSPPVVDPSPLPEYQGAMYGVYRTISGYGYRIPQADFSQRARVIEVGYSGSDGPLFGVQVNGLFVEATGANVVPRTWVPEGQTHTLSAPFHPSQTGWILSYPTPQKILVAISDKPTIDKLQNPSITETTQDLYPQIKFFVKCAAAPSPSP